MVSFTVPGDPVPQGRPKFTTRGGFARAYDPAKSRAYKARVAEIGCISCRRPMQGPLRVTLAIYRPIQKSISKTKHRARVEGRELPVVKPDVDNVFKAVTDALKGITWVDDNQICEAIISKKYSDAPRVEVKIEEINTHEN